jgi:hypothetical protein
VLTAISLCESRKVAQETKAFHAGLGSRRPRLRRWATDPSVQCCAAPRVPMARPRTTARWPLPPGKAAASFLGPRRRSAGDRKAMLDAAKAAWKGGDSVADWRVSMRLLKAIYVALFAHHATAAAVRGGSGHYNEQCHPQTYN